MPDGGDRGGSLIGIRSHIVAVAIERLPVSADELEVVCRHSGIGRELYKFRKPWIHGIFAEIIGQYAYFAGLHDTARYLQRSGTRINGCAIEILEIGYLHAGGRNQCDVRGNRERSGEIAGKIDGQQGIFIDVRGRHCPVIFSSVGK